MKKIILCLMITVFCLLPLSGCTRTPKSGTYTVEFDSFDDHGWKEYVILTVLDEKITGVEFDAKNEAGEKKSEMTAYRETMETAVGTYPEKFTGELEKDLLEKQSVKSVDIVAGATRSSDSFKMLAGEALKNAEKEIEFSTIPHLSR